MMVMTVTGQGDRTPWRLEMRLELTSARLFSVAARMGVGVSFAYSGKEHGERRGSQKTERMRGRIFELRSQKFSATTR